MSNAWALPGAVSALALVRWMYRRSRRCGSFKSPSTIRIMLVLLHSHRLCNPSQIRRRARNNWQRNNLRRLITVQPPYFLLQFREFPPRRLHHQRKFRCRFNFPFPTVNGLHRCRRNVHARCEFLLHNRPRQPLRLFSRRARHHHHYICRPHTCLRLRDSPASTAGFA
jgi:hypothetical protein